MDRNENNECLGWGLPQGGLGRKSEVSEFGGKMSTILAPTRRIK